MSRPMWHQVSVYPPREWLGRIDLCDISFENVVEVELLQYFDSWLKQAFLNFDLYIQIIHTYPKACVFFKYVLPFARLKPPFFSRFFFLFHPEVR